MNRRGFDILPCFASAGSQWNMRAQGGLAYPQQRCDVDGFELWVDADSIAVAHEMQEIHRLAVHEDELDVSTEFAIRNPQVIDPNQRP